MRTVFITGANRGLGLELVKIFLKNGWQVFAACRNHADLRITSDRLKVLELEVANQKHISRLEGMLKDKPLDVLINNAGVYDNPSDGAPLFTDMKDITDVFIVNSIAPRLIAEALLESLRKGKEKLIVNISSNQGVLSLADKYHAEHWPYGGSKAALNWEMATFSKVYPDIKSVLINPGWMKTRLGGNDAPLEPSESAASIYGLIESRKLANGRHYDHRGKITKL